MALANFKPTETPRIQPTDGSVVASPKKHEIYDHRLEPLWSLDSFISGGPWQVEYFRQRLGDSDTPKELDINAPPAYQSYELIQRLELLVQTPLSPSNRDKEQFMEVTGAATVYSFIIPNVNDYFLAESNLARTGLFRVTNVNRRTHERESVYVIEYSLVQELTEENPLFQDLHRKVSVINVFSKQRLIENKNPILLSDTYTKIRELQDRYKDLVKDYFKHFFQTSASTILVPGQLLRTYDPMVADFICQIVSSIDAPEIQRMHLLSVNNDDAYKHDTFWSCMTKRGLNTLSYATRIMSKVRPDFFQGTYFAKSANFGNTDYIVFPTSYDVSSNSANGAETTIGMVFSDSPGPLDYIRTKNGRNQELILSDLTYPLTNQAIPVYTPIYSLETYIFPDTFYDGQANSLIEIVTRDYLKRSPINLEQLIFLLDLYPRLERLEQFYYGPILMTLIKEADRTSYA